MECILPVHANLVSRGAKNAAAANNNYDYIQNLKEYKSNDKYEF